MVVVMKVRADENYSHPAVIHSYSKPLGSPVLGTARELRSTGIPSCAPPVRRENLREGK